MLDPVKKKPGVKTGSDAALESPSEDGEETDGEPPTGG